MCPLFNEILVPSICIKKLPERIETQDKSWKAPRARNQLVEGNPSFGTSTYPVFQLQVTFLGKPSAAAFFQESVRFEFIFAMVLLYTRIAFFWPNSGAWCCWDLPSLPPTTLNSSWSELHFDTKWYLFIRRRQQWAMHCTVAVKSNKDIFGNGSRRQW